MWSQPQIAAALGAAFLLLLVECALGVALVAVSGLSRVALQRMSNGGTRRLAFLAGMREPHSSHRAAASLVRQLCLLGVALLVAWTAQGAGWIRPRLVPFAVAFVAVMLLDITVSRLLALWEPRAALRWTAPLVLAAHAVMYPVVRPLRLLLDRFAVSQPASDEEREEQQEEQVEALIEAGQREGILEATEGQMLRSIVDLDQTLVREIMTPRTDIVALPAETTVAQARRAILDAGHSRLPIYRGSIDNVIGVLHERDVLRAAEERREEEPIGDRARPVIFVPETLTVAELLSEMRIKNHIGLVVDEYGGVSGLVTLEDLLEEIVGEIRDEHDREEPQLQPQDDGAWVIDGAVHVEELERLFGVRFEERDFDTVGGLVVTGFGRVPASGEVLRVQGLEVEVLEADRRRIRRVRVRRGGAPEVARVGA